MPRSGGAFSLARRKQATGVRAHANANRQLSIRIGLQRRKVARLGKLSNSTD
jgi:hypothetical protein